MGFATRHERQLHSEKVHPGRTSSHPSPSSVCEFKDCGKSYSKREHLTRHVRTTHEAPPEKPFGCDLCGVRFVYKHALARHHTNCHTTDVDKPYACAICLLTFKKKSLLQAHSFVHTGVLPFECEDCEERFLKKFQLTRHARKHASAKPSQTQVFMCDHDDCGELLFSLQEKDEHLRDAHGVDIKQEEEKKRVTGRELRCLVCNHTFGRIQNLRSHLRTHFEALDERKLHACPMEACDKAYTKKSNLMAHYNAVHDPVKSRRFQCPYAGCDGAFGYKKVLQTHIASIHEKASVVKNEEGDTHSDSGSEEEEEEKEETKSRMHLKKQEKMKKKRKGRKSAGVLTRVLGLDDRSTTSTPK
jgi:general transcription factor IIIA